MVHDTAAAWTLTWAAAAPERAALKHPARRLPRCCSARRAAVRIRRVEQLLIPHHYPQYNIPPRCQRRFSGASTWCVVSTCLSLASRRLRFTMRRVTDKQQGAVAHGQHGLAGTYRGLHRLATTPHLPHPCLPRLHLLHAPHRTISIHPPPVALVAFAVAHSAGMRSTHSPPGVHAGCLPPPPAHPAFTLCYPTPHYPLRTPWDADVGTPHPSAGLLSRDFTPTALPDLSWDGRAYCALPSSTLSRLPSSYSILYNTTIYYIAVLIAPPLLSDLLPCQLYFLYMNLL